jgi:hypothetical protein
MLTQAVSIIALAGALSHDGTAVSRTAAADREITRFHLALASEYGGSVTTQHSADSQGDPDRDPWRYRRGHYR